MSVSAGSSPSVFVRQATVADAPAIAAIYNHEVEHTTSTFDLVPRSLAEQEAWISARSGAFSAIVAVNPEGEVLGFGALSPYKERAENPKNPPIESQTVSGPPGSRPLSSVGRAFPW